MRKVYMVSYDFNGPSDQYAGLFEELTCSLAWWHFLEGTWLIVTEENADQLYCRLQKYLDDSINLLVAEVGRDRQGWLPKDAWKWINAHLGPKPQAVASERGPAADHVPDGNGLVVPLDAARRPA